MRAVVQRVLDSSVVVDNETVGSIGHGLLVLLGVEVADGDADAKMMAEKLAGLRIFNDSDGKLNLSVEDVQGALLVVSQFTLLGDCRKGRRPSMIKAARPEQAIPLYESVVERLRGHGLPVETGTFGAHMNVHLNNDGPVTFIIDTKKLF